ncbi:MAG: ABC transporter ATP-binding protein [Anaerolineae bacterium]|nr:ABC transporter ATP-binding protein [Anaerolineae bacterium]
MAPLLEARNLRKVYTKRSGFFGPTDENVALDNFSFSVGGDEPVFIAIAGESGSGKTTLAQMLLGFVPPTSGSILYRGQDIHHLNGPDQMQFRQDVQAIFQDPFAVYNPFYKVDHILSTPIRKFGLASSRQDAENLILDALAAVGLRPEDTLGRYPHQLSGGQRQRITVARTLLLRPKLVIADEPVSMVDASLRATILESMYNVHQQYGISFLYITHDLTTAYQVSDSIVILYQGIVAEAGDVDRIIKEPQHPYTQELVRSIPLPNIDKQWIQGDDSMGTEAVDTITPQVVVGCKYAARCPYVMDRCHAIQPPLYQVDPRQVAACYLYDTTPTLEDDNLTDTLHTRPELRR